MSPRPDAAPDSGGLAMAERLEQEGRLAEAAMAYQSVLAAAPDHPEALFRLGLTLGRLGQRDLELAFLGQAIARSPDQARYHQALGDVLIGSGLAGDAAECYEEAARLEPDAPEPRLGLADAYLDLGRGPEARAILDSLPDQRTRARRARARVLLGERRFEEATTGFVGYLREVPDDPAAYFYLGVALQGRELLEAAAASYAQALVIDPTLFEAHANLSTVLAAMGRAPEALHHADEAIRLVPERGGLYLNRANVKRDLGDHAGAIADYRLALAKDPDFGEAWSSLGNLYHDLGEWAQALEAHERAVRAAPTLAQARWNRSFTLLATGHLGAGWDEYEHRFETEAAAPEPRDFPWPRWQGEPLAGKSILVWREQGLGDEILFATCLADLVEAGASVSYLASDRLAGLFARGLPDVDVRPDRPGAFGTDVRFDYQIPVASLPRWLRRERSSFGSLQSPIAPDPALSAAWRDRLAALGPRPKVGICWRSGLLAPDRKQHYAPLDAWAPLLVLPGITWVNLQYDECAAELAEAEARWGVTIHRWPEVDLRTDLETAVALVGELDAVVTAPTVVSSFAGALRVPTWQIDSGSDWTAFGEARSPWFPSVGLIRRAAGTSDWEWATRRAAAELDTWRQMRSAGGR